LASKTWLSLPDFHLDTWVKIDAYAAKVLARELSRFAANHPPSGQDLPGMLRRSVKGGARERAFVSNWIAYYRWFREDTFSGASRWGARSSHWPRMRRCGRRPSSWRCASDYAEGRAQLGPFLTPAQHDALEKIHRAREEEQRTTAEANDWSDVM